MIPLVQKEIIPSFTYRSAMAAAILCLLTHSVSCGAGVQRNAEALEAKIKIALLGLDAYNNPHTIEIVPVLRKRPDDSLAVLKKMVSGLDLRKAAEYEQAIKAVRVVGILGTTTALEFLDAQYRQWHQEEFWRFRHNVVNAVSKYPLGIGGKSLLNSHTKRVLSVLRGWMAIEKTPYVLRRTLNEYSTYATIVEATLITALEKKLKKDVIAVAKRKININAIENYDSRFDQVKRWLLELIGEIENAQYRGPGAGALHQDVISYCLLKLRENKKRLYARSDELQGLLTRSEQGIEKIADQRKRQQERISRSNLFLKKLIMESILVNIKPIVDKRAKPSKHETSSEAQ